VAPIKHVADAHVDDSQPPEAEVAAGSDTPVTRRVVFQIAVTGPPPSVEETKSTGSGLDSESVAGSDSNDD